MRISVPHDSVNSQKTGVEDMVKTQEQLRRAIGALLVCVFAYGVMAQSVPEVPTDWNKDPVTDGAYLEDFESKPAWVDGDSDVTDQDVPAMNGAPVEMRYSGWPESLPW